MDKTIKKLIKIKKKRLPVEKYKERTKKRKLIKKIIKSLKKDPIRGDWIINNDSVARWFRMKGFDVWKPNLAGGPIECAWIVSVPNEEDK
jgi:hypothetical protein